jgi:hypothetical protein
MISDVTKEDLDKVEARMIAFMSRTSEQIMRAVETGFKGTHARHDRTNGHIDELQEATAGHAVHIEGLLKATDEQRRRLEVVERPRPSSHPRRRASDGVRYRDVKLVLATLGAAGAVVLFIYQVLPALIRAFT